MGFIIKTILSALMIAFASWLAGRKPVLAGFIIALPLMSMLAILFSYLEYRDINKVGDFATSIIVAVPLSLLFFVPFVLNKWLKMGFIPIYLLAIACSILAFFIHQLIFKSGLGR
jgi:uncharacterized membrane protein (GlpM family)